MEEQCKDCDICKKEKCEKCKEEDEVYGVPI
jgi:hypothetical protein